MKVLQVQTGDGLAGGIAGYVSSLCRRGIESGYECTVACSDPLSPKATELYGTSSLYTARETYGVLQIPACVREVLQAGRRSNAKVIHAHALRAGFVCALAKALTRNPLIYTNHGLRFTQKTNRFTCVLFYCLEAIVATCANRIICVRQTDFQLLNRCMPWVSTKTTLVTTRIDSAATSSRKSPQQPYLLLGVGSLLPVKNPELFVRWVAGIAEAGVDVRAKWLGDGPLRSSCQMLTEDMGLPVQWCGNVTSDNVRREMAEAALLLLTSDYETAPLVAIEAMSAGLPVVARDIHGICDTIRNNETGVIVQNDNEQSARDAILSVLRHPASWMRLSEGARKAYEKQFRGTDQLRAEYASIYRCAIS